MIYLPDTHALVWYITADKRLGAQAQRALKSVDRGEHQAIIPTLVLAEIMYLEERERIQVRLNDLIEHLQENGNYSVVPFTLEVIEVARKIKNVPELFDRMIAATAIHFEATLLTRDAVFRDLKTVQIAW